jgi:hypothetical protein
MLADSTRQGFNVTSAADERNHFRPHVVQTWFKRGSNEVLVQQYPYHRSLRARQTSQRRV